MDRMREVQASGTTIVVVTHNLHSLDRLAARTVLLSRGRVVYDGGTADAVGTYHQLMQDEARERADRKEIALRQGGDEQTFVGGADVQVRLLDQGGREERTFQAGSEVEVEVTARFDEEVEAPVLGMLVALSALGVPVYTTQTDLGAYTGRHGPDRPLTARFRLDLRLLAGAYAVTCGVFDATGAVQLGSSGAAPLTVVSPPWSTGIADLRAEVEVDGAPVPRAEHRRLDGSLVGRRHVEGG
jgi:lipopolysaccharide transport system ATP-binding protein